MKKPGIILLNPCSTAANNISLAYITAFLRENGYKADFIDLAAEGISPKVILNAIIEQKPILIGVAAYQDSMGEFQELAKFLKVKFDIPIIAGGPQIPAMPDLGFHEMPNIDFLCRGEGELVCLELLRALSANVDKTQIPGISYKLQDKIITNPNPKLPQNLDDYPSPYLNNVLSPDPSKETILLTSRGCSSSCSFCITPAFNEHKIRFHSIERVIKEISYLQSKGCINFWFADPAFSANQKRCADIFNAIIEHELDINIWCQTRADMIDRDLIRIMKQAGVHTIALALETSNQQTLNNINKAQNLEQFTNTIKKIQEHGIKVELMHMIGIPGDDLDTILKNFEYLKAMNIPFDGNSRGNIFRLFFGAPLQNKPESQNIILDIPKNLPAFIASDVFFTTPVLNKDELTEAYNTLEKERKAENIKKTFLMSKKTGIRGLNIYTINNLIKIFNNMTDISSLDKPDPLTNILIKTSDINIDKLKSRISYKSNIILFSRTECLLADIDFFDRLFNPIIDSLIHRSNICSLLTQKDWTKHKTILKKHIQKLTQPTVRLPFPPNLLPQNRFNVYILFDILNNSRQNNIEDIFQELDTSNISILPLIYSDHKDIKDIQAHLEKSNYTITLFYSEQKKYNTLISALQKNSFKNTQLFLGTDICLHAGELIQNPMIKASKIRH